MQQQANEFKLLKKITIIAAQATERTAGKFKGSVSGLTSIQASVSAQFSSVRSSEHLTPSMRRETDKCCCTGY